MGSEIRMVPKDWQHPVDERGHFVPLHDRDYESACREWWAAAKRWHEATDEELGEEAKDRRDLRWYWEWDEPPPDKTSYRPAYASPADHFQIYENVSEGTPCSPVFASHEAMIEWMMRPIDWSSPYNRGCEDWQSLQGKTRESAEAFVRAGRAPSGVFVGGKVFGGIDGLAALQGGRAGSTEP